MSNESESESNEMCVLELMKRSQPPIVDVSLPSLKLLTKLNLPKCDLRALPGDIGAILPNLSILFCPENRFDELPAVIGSCPSLQMVSFKSNQMKRIHPGALQPQLRWLILTDNRLTEIPVEISRCCILQKLMLSGNQIHAIPPEIGQCQNLELVRLSCNQLIKPPMELLALPKLAWIALSDNPFLVNVNPAVPELSILDDIGFDNTDDANVLGRGASGITRMGLLNNRPVAIKAYFGTITSDGNPQREKHLAVVASSIESDCLIQVLGQTSDGSLVMELLEGYRTLAKPPSLESCSRDVYDAGQALSIHSALIILQGLLSVLVEFHARGICHGDFYGHNILISRNDEDIGETFVKLSDFGAAFFYDKTSEYGRLVEKAELRAFAILVDEVIKLVDFPADENASNDLQLLVESCKSATSFQSLQDTWISFHLKGDEHELV